jgi:putative PIN family toxin of toxin-antitoxin system
MRVVADTNVVVSMLFWGAALKQLFEFVNERRVELVFSPATIDELVRVIQYPKIRDEAKRLAVPVEALVDRLIAASVIVYPHERLNVVKDDPTDNQILEAAVESEARFVISGDKHLLKLTQFRGIAIVTPREFIAKYATS